MSRGVLAIFGSTSFSSMDMVKSMTNKYSIPYITWSHFMGSPHDIMRTKVFEQRSLIGSRVAATRPSVTMAKRNNKNAEYDETEYEAVEEEDAPNAKVEYIKSDEEANEFTQLYLRPNLAPVLIELIKFYKWPAVYYIYNHDHGICCFI